MIPSKTVVATSSGLTATGVVTTVATVIQSLEGHPSNTGDLTSGLVLAVSGLIGLITHYHKGANLMANQQDLNNLVSRLGAAFRKAVGSGTAQTVELDISEGLKLAEEMESYAEGITKSAQSSAVTSGGTPTPETVNIGGTPQAETAPPAVGASDFSKLTQQ